MLQPMIAAMGEVHELTHAAGTVGSASAHGDHHNGAGHEDPAAADSESEDPVHLLLHFAHCCSQTPTTLGSSQAQVLVAAGSDAPMGATTELRLKRETNDVLRPPITA